MQITSSIDVTPRSKQTPKHDPQYAEFIERIGRRFAQAHDISPIFTTDAEGLWDAYLAASPEHDRQHRNCHACRHFVERFGGLAIIGAEGAIVSALWAPGAPDEYSAASDELARIVARANVTGVFISSDKTLGTPTTGPWSHLSTPNPAPYKARGLLNASQAAAAKLEELGMLSRGLAEFQVDVVRMAHSHLTNGSLFRSEKHVAAAKWLLDLHERRASTKNEKAREAMTWVAVADAPPGWCHVRSGMLGTLLEDIGSGMPFETLKRRFDEKMDPLAYMRPTAAPAAGAIAQAEKLVDALGITRSLERRFARLDDVQKLWTPAPPKTPTARAGGVFAHLSTKTLGGPLLSTAAPVVMTWEKFARTVLPTAETIEFVVPIGSANFCAFLTATHANAPPILQWDRPEKRNPVSWYVYHGGSPASRWGLHSGSTVTVTAIVAQPTAWDSERPITHHGESVMLVLEGAQDSQPFGLALFPEVCRSELHEVRSVIEAHNRSTKPTGAEAAEVCGLRLQKGSVFNAVVYVVSAGVRVAYKLDRWD